MTEAEQDNENVTICITPKFSTTPEESPSSPTDTEQLHELWESIMITAADGYDTLKQYTVKSLLHFAHYYSIVCPKGGKPNKETLIDLILNFEANPANQALVEQRQHAWQSIRALKTDAYFSKFVLSNLLF